MRSKSTKIQLMYAESSSASKVKKYQNSNQLVKKLVALGFRPSELIEFEAFFQINEP